jgi:hypothetical protein
MADIQVTPSEIFAAAAEPQSKTLVEIDGDLVAWLKAQGMDVTRQVNDQVRFFMETCLTPAHSFETQWEPGEMEEPPAQDAPPWAP